MIASGELSSLAPPGAEPAARRPTASDRARRCPTASRSATSCCTSRAWSSRTLSPTTCRSELKRLDAAIATCAPISTELVEHRDVADGGEHREVLEAYRMFSYDQGWLHKMRGSGDDRPHRRRPASNACSPTPARACCAPPIHYLRERLHDLDDLANRLMRQS